MYGKGHSPQGKGHSPRSLTMRDVPRIGLRRERRRYRQAGRHALGIVNPNLTSEECVMSKKNEVCKRVKDFEAGAVTFAFANGAKVNVYVDNLPRNIQRIALVEGVSQTLGDSYANSGGDAIWACEQVEERLARWKEGEWTRKRQGAMGPRIDKTALAEALHRARPEQALETCQEVIEAQSPESVKALAAGALKGYYLEVMAERAKEAAEVAGPIDLDDLFSS